MIAQPTRRRLRLLGTAGLMILVLASGLVGGILLERRALSRAATSVDVPPDTQDDFELIVEAWRTIERVYVDQDTLEPRQMAYGAIDGIVATLGDTGHTRFLTPEMARRHRSQIQGQFEGIGAYVEMEEGRVVIVAPIDDSPAQRAGLQAGEVILAVDGEDVAGLPLDEVVSRVVGPAGSEVTLTILNPDSGDTREVALVRAEIEIDLVTWRRLPGTDVAYVRVSAFSDGAAEDLAMTLDEIEDEDIGGLLLDLRNNPGGLLDEAVGVASQLVESGDVLLRRDAEGEITAVPVERRVEAVELPIVALVNGGTASAAEIVTGALQDAERAMVVGTTTFGAGTVLNQFTLSDDSLLLMAVEEWLTPKGRVIWQKGLAPDVEVALPADAEALIRPGREDITEQRLRSSDDTQLLRALELLEASITG